MRQFYENLLSWRQRQNKISPKELSQIYSVYIEQINNQIQSLWEKKSDEKARLQILSMWDLRECISHMQRLLNPNVLSSFLVSPIEQIMVKPGNDLHNFRLTLTEYAPPKIERKHIEQGIQKILSDNINEIIIGVDYDGTLIDHNSANPGRGCMCDINAMLINFGLLSGKPLRWIPFSNRESDAMRLVCDMVPTNFKITPEGDYDYIVVEGGNVASRSNAVGNDEKRTHVLLNEKQKEARAEFLRRIVDELHLPANTGLRGIMQVRPVNSEIDKNRVFNLMNEVNEKYKFSDDERIICKSWNPQVLGADKNEGVGIKDGGLTFLFAEGVGIKDGGLTFLFANVRKVDGLNWLIENTCLDPQKVATIRFGDSSGDQCVFPDGRRPVSGTDIAIGVGPSLEKSKGYGKEAHLWTHNLATFGVREALAYLTLSLKDCF